MLEHAKALTSFPFTSFGKELLTIMFWLHSTFLLLLDCRLKWGKTWHLVATRVPIKIHWHLVIQPTPISHPIASPSSSPPSSYLFMYPHGVLSSVWSNVDETTTLSTNQTSARVGQHLFASKQPSTRQIITRVLNLPETSREIRVCLRYTSRSVLETIAEESA